MEKMNLNRFLLEIEINHIKKALEFTDNNVARAAELVGLKRTTLVERLKGLNIVVPRPARKIFADRPIAEKYKYLEVLHSNNVEDQLYNE